MRLLLLLPGLLLAWGIARGLRWAYERYLDRRPAPVTYKLFPKD